MNKITVTITQTFTPDFDPFGLFSLLDAGGGAQEAITEMRDDVLRRDDDALRMRMAEHLLGGRDWVVEVEHTTDKETTE